MGAATPIPTFHISFGKGKDATTIVVPPPTSKRRRKLDHAQWDRDESIRKFQWYLFRCDIEGLEAATDALIRLDCLGDALKGCLKGSRPKLRIGRRLTAPLNSRGLWAIPRTLKESFWCLFADGIRILRSRHTPAMD